MSLSGNTGTSNRWDKAGIGVTLVCLVHCLLLPLLATMFPFLGAGHFEVGHVVLALIAIPIGVAALIPGFRRHKQIFVPLSGFVGLNFLVGSEAYGHLLGLHSESFLSVIGALLLLGAHLANWHLCTQTCKGSCHSS